MLRGAGVGVQLAIAKQGSALFPAIIKRAGERSYGKRFTVVGREARASLSPIPYPLSRWLCYNDMIQFSQEK